MQEIISLWMGSTSPQGILVLFYNVKIISPLFFKSRTCFVVINRGKSSVASSLVPPCIKCTEQQRLRMFRNHFGARIHFLDLHSTHAVRRGKEAACLTSGRGLPSSVSNRAPEGRQALLGSSILCVSCAHPWMGAPAQEHWCLRHSNYCNALYLGLPLKATGKLSIGPEGMARVAMGILCYAHRITLLWELFGLPWGSWVWFKLPRLKFKLFP